MSKPWLRSFFTVILVVGVLLSSLGYAPPTVAEGPWLRVIVQGDSLAGARTAVMQLGGEIDADIPIITSVVARIQASRLPDLMADTGVVRVTQDRPVRLTAMPADSSGSSSAVDVEFPKAIGVQEVWQQGIRGQGVTVAVVDTGIDPRAVELQRGVEHRGLHRLRAYYDAITDQLYLPPKLMADSPKDPNGHGTHVAGIIANSAFEQDDGEFRGVAPDVHLVAVRVLNEEGVGSYADVLRGINWVVENRERFNIRVMNVSMYAVPIAPYWADPYNLAVMAAWQAGIVVVTSVGNTGPAPMSVGVPGNTPYVITVGAFTDHRTPEDFADDYIPEFSATGPTLDGFIKPDVIAPGAHVVSLMRPGSYLREQHPERIVNGRYFEMSGTSMSTGVVSGIVALMLSDHPELTPDQVKYRLVQTARPQLSEATLEAAYSVWEQGAGRVWASDAVLGALEGEANQGMDLASDLAGEQHYQGWTTFDAEVGQFEIIGGGLDGVIDGFTTWDGSFDSWADGYEAWAEGPTNWGGSFDSWADSFDSWADSFDSWADSFDSWADSFDSWADSFDSWADGCVSDSTDAQGWGQSFDSWADSFDSWADSFDSWADFTAWADSFDSWADSFDSWAAGQPAVQQGVGSCAQWADSFDSWADGFAGWAHAGGSLSQVMVHWSGAFGTWEGGYLGWANSFDSWADSFDSWADGFEAWASLCGVEPGSFDSWADSFDSWADSFDSWADYVAWVDSFDSWADSFDSWADSFDSWADGYDGEGRPLLCGAWPDSFDSWADSFDSWADSFDSWADANPNLAGAYEPWIGGYVTWASGYASWAVPFTGWAYGVGDPEWAASYANLCHHRDGSHMVSIDLWPPDFD